MKINLLAMLNKKISQSLYFIIYIFLFIIQGIFIYNIENIFLKKYFFDSYTIINAINKNNYSHLDTSYKITAKVFSIFNFKTLREYNMTCYLIFLIFFMVYSYKNKDLRIKILIFNIIFLFLSSIYLIRPGKEFLQLFIIILCYKYTRLSHVFLIISGLIFRKYLILQGIFFFFLKFYLKNKKNFLQRFIFLITFFILSFTMSDFIQEILVGVREYVNRGREGNEYAKSIINSVIKKEGVWFAYLNYILNILRLLFPVELLTRSIKYLPYVIFQLWFTSKLWKWRKSLNNKVILLYSFILISGIFEPDFGSFLRHTVPYLMIIMALWRKNEKNIIYNK